MTNDVTPKTATKSTKPKSRPAASVAPEVVSAEPAHPAAPELTAEPIALETVAAPIHEDVPPQEDVFATPLPEQLAPASEPVIVETVAAPIEEAPAPVVEQVADAISAPASAEESKIMVAALKLPEIDVPELIRGTAEKTTQRIQASYDKIKATAQDVNDVVEDTFETTRTGFVALNTKALQLVQSNNDAAFKFFKDFIAVKSVEDIVALQTSFVRAQFESVSSQLKDLQDLASQTLVAVSQPSREALVKAVKAI